MHKKHSFSSYLTCRLAVGTLAALASANLAQADMLSTTTNLVQNPGFETGDFTDWTQGGDTNGTSVDTSMPNTGMYSADFQNTSPGSLSQNLATTPGTLYNLSFYVAANPGLITAVVHPFELADLTQPMEFQAYFGGVSVYDTAASGDPDGAYVQITADNLAGTGATTTLEFDFSTNPPEFSSADYFLDDVSVTAAVPEPATWVMLLAGVGLLGAATRLRRPLADVSAQANIVPCAV